MRVATCLQDYNHSRLESRLGLRHVPRWLFRVSIRVKIVIVPSQHFRSVFILPSVVNKNLVILL